jgi:hypothetical protein
MASDYDIPILDVKEICDRIKNAKIEAIELKISKLWDIFALPNHRLLCACKYNAFTGEILLLYDEDFNLIRKIDAIQIDGIDFKPNVIAFNNRDEIYSSNYDGSVFITNLRFHKIKFFKTHELSRLWNVYSKGDYVYACDRNHKKIKIFDLDLDFVGKIDLDYVPKQIQVSKTTLCVNGDTKTCFYSINNDFKLVHKYDRVNTRRVSEIGSNFYEISYIRKKIWCYDSVGFLVEILDIESLDKIIPVGMDIRLLYFKNDLSMYFPGHNILLKF